MWEVQYMKGFAGHVVYEFAEFIITNWGRPVARFEATVARRCDNATTGHSSQGCPYFEVLEHSNTSIWWALCDNQFNYCHQGSLPYHPRLVYLVYAFKKENLYLKMQVKHLFGHAFRILRESTLYTRFVLFCRTVYFIIYFVHWLIDGSTVSFWHCSKTNSRGNI